MSIRFVLGTIVIVGCMYQASLARQSPVTPTSPELVNALRSGGLPAAANLVGHYKAVEDTDGRAVANDLVALARNSELVILGRVKSTGASSLSPDNHSISTEYEIEVEERFQGLASEGVTVRVKMPGGRIQFENGTTAEVWERRMPALQMNLERVLFLASVPNQPDLFRLVLGDQGIFGFDMNGRTISQARQSDEVFRKYSGLLRAEFLAQLRASTGP